MRDEAGTVRTNSSRQRLRALPLPLSAVMLCAAGCAKSDLQIASQNHGNKQQVIDSAIANAPEEKPPKILPQTHYAAGMLFERQGQFDRAIFQYRKAVALNSNYVVAFHRLGLLQSATGQHAEAAKSLQRAVALQPDNAILHNDLGFEWMHAQQWEDAQRELRRAIELQPDLATAHINLGMALAKAGRFSESLASFQAVLPEADAYYNLGLMYQGQEGYAEAREAFRHVLTIEPEFSAAKIQLERLASGAEPPTSMKAAETLAESPPLDRVNDQAPDVTVDALPPMTGPEFMEEQRAVECKHEWGTKLADLAAMLTIIDAHKNWVRPVDPPAAGNPAPVGSSDPCQEEGTTLSVAISTEDVVEAVTELDGKVPVGADFNEEAQTVIEAVESAEPPAPCAAEIIAIPPPAPIARPRYGDPAAAKKSWTMIKELEDKVVMLRHETKAAKK